MQQLTEATSNTHEYWSLAAPSVTSMMQGSRLGVSAQQILMSCQYLAQHISIIDTELIYLLIYCHLQFVLAFHMTRGNF